MAPKPRKGDAAAAANGGGDAGDDLMAWVAKSRKLDEKRRAEKEKAERMARMLADQDDAAAEEEEDDEERGGRQRSSRPEYTSRDLAGLRVRHGVAAVLQEGAAVVLTLKDASILAGDDVNEDEDELENVEAAEQSRRDKAYRAAKKTTSIADKFAEDEGEKKPMLPQYDDGQDDEGIVLDGSGGLDEATRSRLDQVRSRLQGAASALPPAPIALGSTTFGGGADGTSFAAPKVASDFLTAEEMEQRRAAAQFRKPKRKKESRRRRGGDEVDEEGEGGGGEGGGGVMKKKRKKEKLDLDKLEAQARAAGEEGGVGGRAERGVGNEEMDVHGREGGQEGRGEAVVKREEVEGEEEEKGEGEEAGREGGEEEEEEAEEGEEEDTVVIGDDDEDLQRSLQRTRQLALRRRQEEEAAARAAAGGGGDGDGGDRGKVKEESDMETGSGAGGAGVGGTGAAVRGEALVLARVKQVGRVRRRMGEGAEGEEGERGEGAEGVGRGLVFSDTGEFCRGLQLDDALVKRVNAREAAAAAKEELAAAAAAFPLPSSSSAAGTGSADGGGWMEAPVGKGLAAALALLKDRGALKGEVEWGGRTMDKKRSKLVGVLDEKGHERPHAFKEVRIDRIDEFGRVMTPKEAFRKLSHAFHGKGPGKMKQEKRMRAYEEELKRKGMAAGDTPMHSVERLREVQAQTQSPYVVITGHVKPG
ncbi:unnamed protein product [Closterium sp. Yama58-4]|nr:unnamed protein product [Closterium sp. Yama58-4]